MESDFDFPPLPDEAIAQGNLLFDDGRADAVPLHHYATLPASQLPRTPAAVGGTIGNSLRTFTTLRNRGGPSFGAARSNRTPAPPPHPEERYQWRPELRSNGEWDSTSTAEFFEALSQFGTDFSTIAVLFPRLNRNEIMRKYKAEMRRQPDRVLAALSAVNRRPIDLQKLEERKRIADEMRQEPTRPLNAEEEAQLNAFIRVEEAPELTPAVPGPSNNNNNKTTVAAAPQRDPVPEENEGIKDEFLFGDVSDEVPLTVLYSTTREVDADCVPLSEVYRRDKSASKKRARSKDAKQSPSKHLPSSSSSPPHVSTSSPAAADDKQKHKKKDRTKSKSKSSKVLSPLVEEGGGSLLPTMPLSPPEVGSDFISPEPLAATTEFPDELIAEYFSPRPDDDEFDDWGNF